MAGEVAQTALDTLSGLSDPFGLISGAEDAASTVSTLAGMQGKGSGVLSTALSMSLGDYTLVAVGIVLAIGALLISGKPTVIKAVGTVKDAATFAA